MRLKSATGFPMTHPSPILEVENLTVNRDGEVVIENANFSISKGDYVGIVGPNGGGKTTLLNAVLNFLPASKGQINVPCPRKEMMP